jgi:hypothetical protein
MADLRAVANRLGMYDAADAITQLVPRLLGLAYGCHCEPWEGIVPDCVCDYGDYAGCIYAKPGMRREQCKYWKIRTDDKED